MESKGSLGEVIMTQGGLVFSIQAFKWLDEAHPHCGGQLVLLIKTLNLFKNIPTETHKIIFDQLSRHSTAQPSCVHAQSFNHVQLFELCNPMGHNPPSSPVHGVFQARILEWVATSFSKGSSQPRDWICVSCVSCISRQILYHWAIWESPSQFDT